MSDSTLAAVRLAHLSDVHLPPPFPASPAAFINKRALSLLSWQGRRRHHHLAALSDAVVADIARWQPDLVTMTGDLTNFGLPSECQAGARWLDALPGAAVVVPGNHDRMVRAPWSSDVGVWGAWMPPSAGLFPYVYRLGPVAVIGVNSAIASPPFMAYGRVGRVQAERLGAILRRTRALCRVVLIHHPPRAGLVPWRKSLLDKVHVGAVLKAAGAEIVLHGHSHDASLATVRGTDIPLLGAPSASLDSSRPTRRAGWNALTVTSEQDGWRITLVRRMIRPDRSGAEDVQHRVWLRPREGGALAP